MARFIPIQREKVKEFFDDVIDSAQDVVSSADLAIIQFAATHPIIGPIAYRKFRRRRFTDFPYQDLLELILRIIELFIEYRNRDGDDSQ